MYRITAIKILDTPAKPFEALKDADGRSLDLYRYMTEHNAKRAAGKYPTALFYC